MSKPWVPVLAVALASLGGDAHADPAATKQARDEAYNRAKGLYCGRALEAEAVGQVCSGDDTGDKCYRRLLAGPFVAAQLRRDRDARAARTQATVEEVVTPLALPGFAGALPGLLPGVRLANAQPVFEALDDPHTLGISLATPLRFGARFDYFTLDVSGFWNPRPEVHPVLKASLLENDQHDLLRTREAEPELGDDVIYQAGVTVTSSWVGRDARHHADLFGNLLARSSQVAAPGILGLSGQEVQERGRVLDPFFDVRIDDDPRGREVASCIAGEMIYLKKGIEQKLRHFELDEFYRLVNAQPQLSFVRRQWKRSGTVGADAYSNRLTLATGLANNLSWLRLSSPCRFSLDKDSCPGRYRSMVLGRAARWGLGLSAFVERGNLETLMFDVPLAAPPLPGPATEQVVVEGGDYRQWGASVGISLLNPDPGADGPRRSMRLDVAYQDTEYDNHEFRFGHDVWRVTLTYRVGLLSLPVHLVYRETAEFEGSVADKAGVALGVGSSW